MNARLWQHVKRILPERFRGLPVPIGRVARHRRLLRRALSGGPVGRVLVVGPWRSVRQAFPAADMDVAGTSPHTRQVTVCSDVRAPGCLPSRRWDTVIVSDQVHLSDRLRAVQPACRPGARVVLIGPAASASTPEALLPATSSHTLETHRDRVRIWRLP